MKIAFKTYEQAPTDQVPASIPMTWPWYVAQIADDQQTAFESSGFTVLSVDLFAQYKTNLQTDFDLWANAYDVNKTSQELRVMDYVAEKFKSWEVSKIDFRQHLQTGIYFQKDVTMLPNGRPQKSLYYYNSVLIAEIEFTFEVNQFNFMTRRIEKLAYYKKSGERFDQWVIADDIFDVANSYHLREMMKERSGARASIFEEVKAFLNGVLANYYIPQGKTYPEILEIAGDFWQAFGNSIDSWINVGSPQFHNLLTDDVTFPFLDVEISAGVTVRAYVLSKTSY